MSFRTVVVKNRAKLELRLGYMVVRSDNEKQIHLSEIGTLIVESTAVAMTSSLICELIKRQINIIFCDERHMPHSYLLPFNDNFAGSKNIRQQTAWIESRKAEVWQEIVRQKIINQAKHLHKCGHIDEYNLLMQYAGQIDLADAGNREGHAAKVYFNALFSHDFSRREPNMINDALNYGYAILLSHVSREIAAAGYITQLGIWHTNEFNQFNLASDLMEPFRPIIDDYVISLGGIADFKQRMPALLLTQVIINGQNQFFEAAIKIFVRNVLKVMGETGRIEISEIEGYTLGEYEL